jgi:hypothetical protein
MFNLSNIEVLYLGLDTGLYYQHILQYIVSNKVDSIQSSLLRTFNKLTIFAMLRQTTMIQNTNIVDIDYIDRLKDVVIRDIKNEASQQEKDMLEDNVDMWLYNLRVIRRDVEFQLSSNKAKNKIKALEMKEMGASTADVESFITKQNKWRINTIKFLTSIERKMLYVKMINNPLD